MSLNIIDTHAHLDMPEFDPDRDLVLRCAFEGDVAAVITVGINLASNRRAIALADLHPRVWAVVGIHPQDSHGVTLSDIDELARQAQHPKVVAIGEIGLDFYRDVSPHPDQFQALRWQLALAQKSTLPAVIHCRQAQNEILPVLAEWAAAYPLPAAKVRGVLHNFRDDLDLAQRYIDLGFYFSIGAYLGYPASKSLRAAVAQMPLERLLIETDCPFLAPQEFRGRRNEPAYTPFIVQTLAAIKNLSPADVARRTADNARRVFNLVLPAQP